MQVQSTFVLHQLQSKGHHSSLALTELLLTYLDFWKMLNESLIEIQVFLPSIQVVVMLAEAEIIQKLALDQEWKWKLLSVEITVLILVVFFMKPSNSDS